MKFASYHLLRLVGLTTLLLVTVTRASSDAADVMTPQEEAVCGTLTAPVPQFVGQSRRSSTSALRVVAIGSSSTFGMGASQPSLSYVSQLAGQLKILWPARSEVINRGVNGDTLADIVNRAPRDLYAQKPDVVVLQTGTNDALRNVSVSSYEETLQSFVGALK